LDNTEVIKGITDAFGLSAKDAQELLHSYLEDIFEELKKLKSAFEAKDLEMIAKIAHSVKGASGNLRVNKMYELSAELEQAAKQNNIEDCAGLFSLLEAESQSLQ